MAEIQYVLWTLNRATDWRQHLLQALRRGGVDAVAGDRNRQNRRNLKDPEGEVERSRPTELMHEGGINNVRPKRTQIHEYHVPIPVKCIGSPERFRRLYVDPDDTGANHRLDAIVAHYSEYFAEDADVGLDRYWGAGLGDGDPAATTRMNLKKRDGELPGMYEAMRRSHGSPYARHILVGYSQGGVVARYLAFLDEHLAKRPAVAGIVTAHAPNFGSPLARAANVGSVGVGLAKTLSSLGGYNHHEMTELGKVLEDVLGSDALLKIVRGRMLEAAIADMARLYRRRNITDDLRGDRRQKLHTLTEAYKWMSGIADDARFAFPDLSPERLNDRFSVLGALHRNRHEEIFHGAVVGAGSELLEIARGVVHGVSLIGLPIGERKLEPLFGMVTAALGYYADRATSSANSAFQLALLDEPLTREAAKVRERYVHALRPTDGAGEAFGIDDHVALRAHDFVIPAGYQLIQPGSERFLGNRINPDANHLTGAEALDPGRTSRDLAMGLLEDMARKLPRQTTL